MSLEIAVQCFISFQFIPLIRYVGRERQEPPSCPLDSDIIKNLENFSKNFALNTLTDPTTTETQRIEKSRKSPSQGRF